MPTTRLREVRVQIPVEAYEAIRAVAKKEHIQTQDAIAGLIMLGLEANTPLGASKPRVDRHIMAVPEPEAIQ